MTLSSQASRVIAFDEAQPEPVRGGVRAAAKARSRRRLLDAAKRLFMERGYEGGTVRDIAAAADLSTGAVFASFADKADLFNEVLLADCPAQIELMERRAARPFGRVQDRLVGVLSEGYRFQHEQLQLMRAALAVSWSQGLNGALCDRPIRQAAEGAIRRILEQAIAAGELRADAELDLIVEMVWDSYVANYRHALFAGFTVDQLTERFRRQVEALLAGQAARN
jgi:AcrR family transcriptional regulator